MRTKGYSNLIDKIQCSDEFRDRMEKMLDPESENVHSEGENIRIVNSAKRLRPGNLIAALSAFVLVFGAGASANRYFSNIGYKSAIPGRNVEVTEYSEPETTEVTVKEKFKEMNDGFIEKIRKENSLTAASHAGKGGFSNNDPYYDSVSREYTVTDPEKFITEIIGLGSWMMCSEEEYNNGILQDKENNIFLRRYMISVPDDHEGTMNFIVSENGYLEYKSNNYRLDDEADINKLGEIFKDHLTMKAASELAEKIHNGMYNFRNLRAEYSYVYEIMDSVDGNDGYYSDSVGTLLYDAVNMRMYMDGHSSDIYYGPEFFVKIAMNGENRSACRIINAENGECEKEGLFAYPYTMGFPQPDYHYIYLYKQIEVMLSGSMLHSESYMIKDDEITVNEIDDNITEYSWDVLIRDNQDQNTDSSHCRLQLTKAGQIVSFKVKGSDGYHESFTLENYEFDSDSFEALTEAEELYDSIEAEKEIAYVGNYVGQDYNTVMEENEAYFVFSVKEAVYSQEPEDTILEQDVEPGSACRLGHHIQVVISKGPEMIEVPPMDSTITEAAAKDILEENFRVQTKLIYNDEVPEGQLIRTEPEAFTQCEAGSTVLLIISRGSKPE